MLLFKSLAACLGEMVSTIFRLRISSAISRPVHWLIGLPDSAGGAQASASSWQRWSAVILAGAPGRGRSSNRSATLISFSGIGSSCNQRFLHRLTVLRFTPTRPPIVGLSWPLAAKRMILARLAICWPVLCPFSTVSNPCRIVSDNSITSAFGPGIFFSLLPSFAFVAFQFTLSVPHPPNYFRPSVLVHFICRYG